MPSERWTVVTNWRDLKHPQSGGAELVCHELASRLALSGRRVILLCSRVRGEPRKEWGEGYLIRRAGGRFTVYLHALLWLMCHRASVSSVVDSQNGIPFFTPVAVRRRTVVVLLLHHIHQDQFRLYFSKPMAAVGRWLESTASRAVYGRRAIVAVSPSTRQSARTMLGMKGSITVAPPGFRITLDRQFLPQAKSQPPSVVTVGRLVPHKRTHLAIEAMEQLRNGVPGLRLDIVGGGEELPALQALAARLGVDDSVAFHPHCSPETRDRLVASASLCINASEGEGWGISVIEANALGTTVLAYARPGLRDSIAHGTSGWLIDDNVGIGDAALPILRELGDPEVARSYAEMAMSWADHFTWDAMGESVLQVIQAEALRLTEGAPFPVSRRDTSTLAHVPHHLIPSSWAPELLPGESVAAEEGGMTVFLPGLDTGAGPAALRRLGLFLDGHDHEVSYRVARTRDLLTPVKSWD